MYDLEGKLRYPQTQSLDMDNEVKKPMASSLVDIVLSLEASVLKLVVSRAEEGKQPREILSENLGVFKLKTMLTRDKQ